MRSRLSSAGLPEGRRLKEEIDSQGIAAFEPLVRAAAPRLYRVAVRITGSAADAEDAVQEAFARAFDALKAGRYDERLRMEAWLVTIVTRVCIDSLRARRENGELAPEAAAVGLPEEQRLALVELSRWMEGLPPDQRAAVVLKFMEEMTSAEVAAALGVSEGAVEQRILRARAMLRKRMGSDVDG